MHSKTVLAVLVAAAFMPLAQAQQKPDVKGVIATAPGKGVAAAVVTATATVTAIDAATRTVTLKGENGHVQSVVAGDEVKNFAHIKVGDKLTLKYAESLTLELKKGGGGVVGKTEAAALERSKPGAKPGGVAQHTVTVLADVVAVDEAGKKVSVKTAKGDIYDLNIQDPAQLKLVKVGDQVQATYTVALAISMQPAAAAAPAAPPKK